MCVKLVCFVKIKLELLIQITCCSPHWKRLGEASQLSTTIANLIGYFIIDLLFRYCSVHFTVAPSLVTPSALLYERDAG